MRRCVAVLFSLYVFASISALSGCGGGSSTPPPPSSQLLSIMLSNPPAGTVDVDYPGFTFNVASGGRAPFTWSESGSLPPGLVFSSGGVLSGTPTRPGSVSIAVTVVDNSSPPQTASKDFTISINNAKSSSLTISSGPPPNGAVRVVYNRGNGVTCAPQGNSCYECTVGGSLRSCPSDWRYEFSFHFTASGGQQPYTWTWAAAPNSSLPPSLILFPNGSLRGPDGYWHGKPTTSGTYSFIVTATDSGSPTSQVSATYIIVIAPPPAPTIGTAPTPSVGAINLPYSFTFSVATGGQFPFNWSETGMLPPGLMFNNDGELSGTPTALGSFPVTVIVQDGAGQDSAPQEFVIQVLLHGFKTTGSMGTGRSSHTATLLNDGKVLVAGGYSSAGGLSAAEVFDPSSEIFTPTGSMQSGRFGQSATLLSPQVANGGKVLMAGGNTATAELYDPSNGTFTPTGSMATLRSFQTSTQLRDGRVLVTGGRDVEDNPVASAELYDPAIGTFTLIGSMATARYGHTATLLDDGTVLVTGGMGVTGQPLVTAEQFDTSNGTFRSVGSMGTARDFHAATLLASGKVLVTGGGSATAELFDPVNLTFEPTGNMGMSHSAATLLNDGTVLVTGGGSASAELYDPAQSTFTPTGSLGTARIAYTQTLLKSGQVLVTGGSDTSGNVSEYTAEIYK
jgi:hypothetical protein